MHFSAIEFPEKLEKFPRHVLVRKERQCVSSSAADWEERYGDTRASLGFLVRVVVSLRLIVPSSRWTIPNGRVFDVIRARIETQPDAWVRQWLDVPQTSSARAIELRHGCCCFLSNFFPHSYSDLYPHQPVNRELRCTRAHVIRIYTLFIYDLREYETRKYRVRIHITHRYCTFFFSTI